MMNPTKAQLEAKYKRARAALLNLQADALELQAEKKFKDLTEQVQEKYQKALSESENLMDRMKTEGENIALDVIESIENQTYSLHTELQSVKKSIKNK